MKKLFLTGAVVLAMTMVSCGGSKSEKAATDGSDSVAYEEVDIVEVEAVAVDTAGVAAEGQGILDKLKNSKAGAESVALANQAKDYISKLISSGKLDEAKKYFEQVGPYIKEKAPKVYESINSIMKSDKLDAVKEKASEIVGNAKEKGAEMTEAAKDKASELKDKAADKIKNALN